MALMANVQAFISALTDLRALCSILKKYEATFSPEAKQLFKSVGRAADQAEKELEHLPSDGDGSIASYLATGNKTMKLRAVLQNVQQSVSSFTSGAIPVPRSSKEELSRVHGLIVSLKFALSSEQQLLITQLRKLCVEVEAQKKDFDVIETNLDNAMRTVLQQVHGKTMLEPELLYVELERMQTWLMAARADGDWQLEGILSLALNSIQRLHVGHNSESAGTDDDDEDPFFMPMPGAIKWADEAKFKELAKPLAPEQPADKHFMIVMDDDSIQTPSSMAGMSAEPSASTLVGTTPGNIPQQQSPVPEEAVSPRESAAAAILGANAASPPPRAASEEAAPIAQRTPSQAAASSAAPATTKTSEEPPPNADHVDGKAPPRASLAPADKPALPEASQTNVEEQVDQATTHTAKPDAAAGATTDPPAPEKLNDFVNFLNGENPGACMFHAQMRLSYDGCVKLANFLKSSARVRALSLSHNYLGDEGLRLICEGLRENKSVTALDLPDNNITDVGAEILASAIKDNPSLTQLQLAYNKIGDQGALALAQVIRASHSLKKLGLAYNKIGKAGCQALTTAISSNQSLKQMQLLPGNPVEEKDAKALAKALKRNNKFSIKQLLGLKGDN